jgi:hypothetical protein
MAATDKVGSIYSKGTFLNQWGGAAGMSYVLRYSRWNTKYDYKSRLKAGEMCSERVLWIGLRGELANTREVLLDPLATYGNAVNEEIRTTYEAYATLNYFFHSALGRYRWYSSILSGGIGPVDKRNYGQLKDYTLEIGRMVQGPDSTQYQAVLERKDGKLGPVTNQKGVGAYLEAFYPVAFSRKAGAIYISGRYTFVDPFASDQNVLFSWGVNVTVKDHKTDTSPIAKDVFGFAVLFDYANWTQRREVDYLRNNLVVSLRATVPLRFI